jgi:hypothetical protein
MEQTTVVADAVYDHVILAAMRELHHEECEIGVRLLEQRFGVEFYP